MSIDRLIGEALEGRAAAICFRVGVALREAFPGAYVLETEDGRFAFEDYAADGHCSFVLDARAPSSTLARWDGDEQVVVRNFDQGVAEIRWRDRVLRAVRVVYEHANGSTRTWLVADDQRTAEGFFADVCRWWSEVRGEVLVFEDGAWEKSEELFASIKNASFESLVLPQGLLAAVREDCEGFFAARATYERYGVTWKRGVLFTGPPGNGKTHTIKALCGALGRPVLYVKSLRAKHGNDHQAICQVFARARQAAPCVVVLEDLDSIVDDGNRSFFLNELDGFAGNTGLLVLATTNHPERLDPALVQRPSRFDRRYAFELPEAPERARYLERWSATLEPDLRLSPQGVTRVAALTDGFSFAYLKELALSSLMAWMRAPAPGEMDAVMAAQAVALREQIKLPKASDVAVGRAPQVGFVPQPGAASRG